MNQIERLSTICEELSEEIHAAIQNLRTANSEMARGFPFTWGYVSQPILEALDALERAERLVGPFEPSNLPQSPPESPYDDISKPCLVLGSADYTDDAAASDLDNENYHRDDEREYSRIHTQ